MQTRCEWVALNEPLYVSYHDEEWGRPIYDPLKLFEFLLLEGVQAGLSWLTVLKKRAHYQKVFDAFNPEKIAKYDSKKIAELLADPGIIRNKLKVNAAVKNANAYLRLQEEGINFSDYLWEFVGGAPKVNHWTSLQDIPTETPESKEMSKTLKKAGFTFVGPTICYAFMQAVGMVNDHTKRCYLYEG